MRLNVNTSPWNIIKGIIKIPVNKREFSISEKSTIPQEDRDKNVSMLQNTTKIYFVHQRIYNN